MEKKRKVELEVLNTLKEKKMNEVFGKTVKKEKKEPKNKAKKQKKFTEGIIIQVGETGTKSYLKKSTLGKKRLKRLVNMIIFLIFISKTL